MARPRRDLPLEATASVDDRDVLAAIARARRCLMATDPVHPGSDRLLAFRVAGSPTERLDALLAFADAIGAGPSARRAVTVGPTTQLPGSTRAVSTTNERQSA